MTITPYVASNGFEVLPAHDGSVRVDNLHIGVEHVEALIQYIEDTTGVKFSEPL